MHMQSSLSTSTAIASGHVLTLGQDFGKRLPTDYFRGEIGEFMVFDRALSDLDSHRLNDLMQVAK